MYDKGLLIGRFQPFHNGHMHAIVCVLGQVSHLLLGIGSSNRSIEKENPFTAQERELMIQKSLNRQQQESITMHPIPDVQNHIKWIAQIEQTLPRFDVIFTNDSLTHKLYMQRGVPVRNIPFLDREHLSGTNIRHRISTGHTWHHLVPAGTAMVVEPIQDRLRL